MSGTGIHAAVASFGKNAPLGLTNGYQHLRGNAQQISQTRSTFRETVGDGQNFVLLKVAQERCA